mgnify:CR=1 FL=1
MVNLKVARQKSLLHRLELIRLVSLWMGNGLGILLIQHLMWNINPQQQWDHGIKQVATMMTESYLNF